MYMYIGKFSAKNTIDSYSILHVCLECSSQIDQNFIGLNKMECILPSAVQGFKFKLIL